MHRELLLGDAEKDNHLARIDGQVSIFLRLFGMAGFVFATAPYSHARFLSLRWRQVSKEIRERRRGIFLFYGPPSRGGFKGMVRLRVLVIYPQWSGTEVITTVLY